MARRPLGCSTTFLKSSDPSLRAGMRLRNAGRFHFQFRQKFGSQWAYGECRRCAELGAKRFAQLKGLLIRVWESSLVG
jgi:hypothetical protein